MKPKVQRLQYAFRKSWLMPTLRAMGFLARLRLSLLSPFHDSTFSFFII